MGVTPRDIVLLGSTGSIGTQAIDIVRRHRDRFNVVALGASGSNIDRLAQQAVEFQVPLVGVARAPSCQDLTDAIQSEACRRGLTSRDYRLPKIVAGPEAMTELAQWPCDVVLNGMVGSVGLAPTLAAVRAGRILALANKESLVVGGPIVRAALRSPDQIVPVDSEHSALAQALRSGVRTEVHRLVLTASGGPFRGVPREELVGVTPQHALAHPTWNMGPVITINCATLVNKGLEVIEAHELFGISYDQIDVVVHPQSIVHSMVEFYDGSTVAQCGPPDMGLPISLALGWPDRVPEAARPIDWTQSHNWQFFPLDERAFPAVALAKESGRKGQCLPAIYNAANEECVDAFLHNQLPFLAIVDTVERVLAEAPNFGRPSTVEDVMAAETWARIRAKELLSLARKEA